MPVPAEAESLIADAPVSAHLATAVDDRPHVAAVWYGYRDGTLYVLTGGRKLANVRRNPRVSVSIERARDGDVDWNVTLLGRATVVDDPERVAWANGWIFDRYDHAATDADVATDGGEPTDADHPDDAAYALLEIDVGSASWNVYE